MSDDTNTHGERRGRLGRIGRVAVVAAAVGLIPVLAVPAHADVASDEARLLALTNQDRAAAGVPPLTLDPGLSAIARVWAGVMALQGAISHNTNLAAQVTGNWVKVGENVGMGGTVDYIHYLILGSPAHFRNATDPAFNRIGIGIVHANNAVWMVQDFAQIGAAPAPAPEPEPEPEPEPAPAPVPRPRVTTPAPEPAPAPAPTPTTVVEPAPAPTTTTAPTTVAPTPTTAPPATTGLSFQLALMVGQLRAP